MGVTMFVWEVRKCLYWRSHSGTVTRNLFVHLGGAALQRCGKVALRERL
jgi:hypothetical protein